MALVPVPVLSDGVVTLRGHREDDLAAIVEQSTDPLSRRWTKVPIPYGLDDARRFVHDVMPGGWASGEEWGFALEAVDSDGTARYGGTVSLRNEEPGRAEIAYGSHPWIRGKGYVERALRLLLEWGFVPATQGGPGLESVIWWAEVGNWASRKTAWRLGFSCEGTLERRLNYRGRWADAWVGGLTKDAERVPRNPWLEVPRIIGDGVVLRVHRDSDAPHVAEACGDERTAYWLGGLPQPYTIETAERFVRERHDGMARGTALHWVVADPEDDRLQGVVSLMDLTGPTGPEVGYWTHPRARGRGVMTEAVRLACRHAFIDEEDGGLGLEKLRLVSAVDNTASRYVAEASGFRLVGIERQGTRCRDGWHDTSIYDLLASDGAVSQGNT